LNATYENQWCHALHLLVLNWRYAT